MNKFKDTTQESLLCNLCLVKERKIWMFYIVDVNSVNGKIQIRSWMPWKRNIRVSQCPECGSVTGFDPMAIVQKKLSYGKRRRKRKFGGGCHCPGHKKFGKKVSKKPSAATRKMCKRLKVKMTLKRGGKRVYKSEKMLKKQCKTAMKKKSKKKTVKRRKRKSSFVKKQKNHRQL